MAMRPFRAPRVPRSFGQVSPLAIALSTVGAGLQGYGKDKAVREETMRLNEAESYRRKMEKLKTEQAAAELERERNAQTKDRAKKIQALTQTTPSRLGRRFTQQEAEAIADGVINPSDLFPNAPQSSATTANVRRQQAIDSGMTVIRMMSGGGGDYTPAEQQSFWTSFNLAVGGPESDLSQDEKAVVANNVFNQWKKTVETARAQRNQRRRIRVSPDSTATNAAGQPIMPGTPGIPMYSREANPNLAQQDSVTMARLQAIRNSLKP